MKEIATSTDTTTIDPIATPIGETDLVILVLVYNPTQKVYTVNFNKDPNEILDGVRRGMLSVARQAMQL